MDANAQQRQPDGALRYIKAMPHWPVSGSQKSAYRCGGSGGVAETSQIEGFSAPHFPFTPTQSGLAGRIVGHQVMEAMYCS